jgi:hypothetical protein
VITRAKIEFTKARKKKRKCDRPSQTKVIIPAGEIAELSMYIDPSKTRPGLRHVDRDRR